MKIRTSDAARPHQSYTDVSMFIIYDDLCKVDNECDIFV